MTAYEHPGMGGASQANYTPALISRRETGDSLPGGKGCVMSTRRTPAARLELVQGEPAIMLAETLSGQSTT